MRLGRPPIVVCGSDPVAGHVVDGLRADRRRVVRVGREQLATIDLGGVRTLILADPPDPSELVVDILARAKQGRRKGERAGQRLILMHRQDPPPPLPAPDPDGPLRLETFAIQDRAARDLLMRRPLHLGMDPPFRQGPHLLMAGFAEPAQAILVQALRLIHYGNAQPRITVLCDRSREIAGAFLSRHPQATKVADIRFAPLRALRADRGQPADVDTVESASGQVEATLGRDRTKAPATPPAEIRTVAWSRETPVTLVVVCLQDPPGLGLEVARRLARDLAAMQGVSPPILLEIGDRNPDGQVEDWDGQTVPFSYLRDASRAAVLLEGRGDEVARTIHDHYRDSIAAQGRDPDAEPAARPWKRLATSYRQANRHQADHVWAKLAVADCRAVPEEMVESFALTPSEVEQLAVIEHQRWAADRYLDGWSYAAVRDNQRKHHPQLVSYAELSEPMKDLDRFAVRGLPALLARQGLGIVRLLILGIPRPSSDCACGPPLRRLIKQVLDRLRSRYPDRVLILASTLTDRQSRGLVRAAMDQHPGVGLFLLLPQPINKTLTELTDRDARRDFLMLAARAERRISLQGDEELATWFSERARITLILGRSMPARPEIKAVRLDAARERLEWSFEY
ncbi:MAG: Ryanodine receptor Ryr [Thiocapsa sp.]|nr:RyR domain-containing protein [Thiocapsa sp.]MCG6983877.1 Ryanodine receptor Ryr [Thiocapsa sp.]